jgi:anti-sigma regulatory factor (Ser/Thr protein kinase)
VRSGLALEELRAAGRYRAFDARETLDRFVRGGTPDTVAFGAEVTPIIASASLGHQPVRVFGEMVALLWDDGNVTAALELETMWNELRAQYPFTLYCAYPMSTLDGDADLGDAKRICDAHSRVVALPTTAVDPIRLSSNDDDENFVRTFAPTLSAARVARRFVAAALRALGEEELTIGAALITSELATNAIKHGRSPFTVTVSPTGSTIEIAVRDASASGPRLRPSDASRVGGRGIALVAAIAADWGTRTEPDGKAVWATLARERRPIPR